MLSEKLINGKFYIMFFCFFIVPVIFVSSDTVEIDSLRSELIHLRGHERVSKLNELAEIYAYENPQRAIIFAQEALQLSQKFKLLNEEASAYKNLADSYFYLNLIDKSLEMYELAAEKVKMIHGETSEPYQKRLGDIGYCLEMLFRYDDAIVVYQKALQIATELEINDEKLVLLNNIGQAYFKSAHYDKAIEYFEENLQLERQFGKPEDLSGAYNNIAMVYKAWEQYEKAIPYFAKAVEIDREFNNDFRLAIRLNNLGAAYRSLEQYDKALEYLDEALVIERKIGRRDRIAIRLGNIALIYIYTKDFDKALTYLHEQQSMLEGLDAPQHWVTLLNHLGHAYRNIGQLKKAEDYLLKSQKIAREKELKQHLLYNYRELSNIYLTMENYRKAFKNLTAFHELKDSIFTEEKHRQLAEFEKKYETEKKENEIVMLKKNSEIQDLQIKQQRVTLWAIGIGFVIILALGFIIFTAYQREKKEIVRRKKAEAQLQEWNQNLEKRVETEVRIRTEQEHKAIEQSRLAALGELAAGIAHEINQPLHSIAFSIDNMTIAIEEDDADKEYLLKKAKKIFDDTDRMKRIIDHIRTFSRKQMDADSEPFNINDSITNAVNMVREQYAVHQIKLEVELAENMPPVKGNLYRFEQVVLIFLSNGKDAVEEKTLSADKKYQKSLSFRSYYDESKVYLKCSDNGTGISPEQLDKIFNPFYTTKKPGQGTGLGLSIAYGIISDMDGEIDVTSKEEEGTTMIVSLPIVSEENK